MYFYASFHEKTFSEGIIYIGIKFLITERYSESTSNALRLLLLPWNLMKICNLFLHSEEIFKFFHIFFALYSNILNDFIVMINYFLKCNNLESYFYISHVQTLSLKKNCEFNFFCESTQNRTSDFSVENVHSHYFVEINYHAILSTLYLIYKNSFLENICDNSIINEYYNFFVIQYSSSFGLMKHMTFIASIQRIIFLKLWWMNGNTY